MAVTIVEMAPCIEVSISNKKYSFFNYFNLSTADGQE